MGLSVDVKTLKEKEILEKLLSQIRKVMDGTKFGKIEIDIKDNSIDIVESNKHRIKI